MKMAIIQNLIGFDRVDRFNHCQEIRAECLRVLPWCSLRPKCRFKVHKSGQQVIQEVDTILWPHSQSFRSRYTSRTPYRRSWRFHRILLRDFQVWYLCEYSTMSAYRPILLTLDKGIEQWVCWAALPDTFLGLTEDYYRDTRRRDGLGLSSWKLPAIRRYSCVEASAGPWFIWWWFYEWVHHYRFPWIS